MNNLFFIIVILFTYISNSSSSEIRILYKINDDIVTSYDVDYEMKYLLALNQNLRNLPKQDILIRAEKSIIREKIKKNQIDKIYSIDYERAINDKTIIDIINNFRLNLGFADETSFLNYLNENDIVFKDLKKICNRKVLEPINF